MPRAMPNRMPGWRRSTAVVVVSLAVGAASPGVAQPREGVQVAPKSEVLSGLVSERRVEQQAAGQYVAMLQQAGQAGKLLPPDHPQVVRLRAIANRLIPHAAGWNPRAREWRWEVNVLADKSINAFCMPGGKIAFFYGILARLQLTDDEVAMIMGHEMAHALYEHAREQMGTQIATRGLIEIVSALFGLGTGGRLLADASGYVANLKFGRDDEREADLIGLELAARAGYDPRASLTLWNKMAEAQRRGGIEFLSTHPSGPTRISDLQRNIPLVEGLYRRAGKPPVRYAPP